MQNKSHLLKYLKHHEIDSDKWNRCIDNAPNCRVYAYDWYLDRTAVVWDALIWGDYEYVMPLPFRKKIGIKYLYHPLFSQQLGIFPIPSEKIGYQFYNRLLKEYRYAVYQINSGNSILSTTDEIHFSERKNYLLPLNQEYEQLEKSYSKNTKRNLAKAKKNNLSFVSDLRLEDYLNFKKDNLINHFGKNDFNKLKSLIAYAQYKGFGKIYGIYSADNNLCAAVYFCRWKDRLIYMNAASNEQGKELRAMYFLIDNMIKKHTNKNITLDFEGSMLPGVARFFDGFGARPETYFQLKFNNLPLPLKWFKR